ncbi:uncharacterized protein LOC143277387 [Babylonia areolata]|uniref:uncharacterized protein LOC143277387 n=1 Tax=Babylonia areolata TaxID=304850 RepID=UPI003FD60EDC
MKLMRIVFALTPGRLALTAPANKSTWEEEELINLTCSGPVGLERRNTTIAWVWEYKDPDSATWTRSHSRAIHTGSVVNKTCYQRQSSSLQRRVTVEDSRRVFRCYVKQNGRGYPQFALSYTMGTVTMKEAASKTGLWISIAIAGCIILIGLIVVVYLFTSRRQKAKKSAGRRPSHSQGSMRQVSTDPVSQSELQSAVTGGTTSYVSGSHPSFSSAYQGGESSVMSSHVY